MPVQIRRMREDGCGGEIAEFVAIQDWWQDIISESFHINATCANLFRELQNCGTKFQFQL